MAPVDGIFWLCVWMFCAFGAGWVADTKGYSFVAWLLVGMLGGPFAVLVVGLAEPKERSAVERGSVVKVKPPETPKPPAEESKVYEIP